MSDIPWRIAIERALTIHHGSPHSRWVQLATVGPGGGPRVRTVVFRGFLGDGPVLRFTTDMRSEKVGQVFRDPRAEACWLFPDSREQFRLAGLIRVVGEGHPDPALRDDRASTWEALPPASRAAFSWPDPGAPRAEPRRFRVAPPDPHRPPPSFALLLLDPDRVEHLDLRTDPHGRTRYRRLGRDEADDRRGAWESTAVNP